MCWEDVEIGRSTASGQLIVTPSNTELTQLIAADTMRFALVIGAPATGNLFLTLEPGSAVATGMIRTLAMGPLVLNLYQHGDLVRRAWFASHSAGSVPITLFTTVLPLEKGKDYGVA